MIEYTGLSMLYDDVMEDAPYEPWFRFLTERFRGIASMEIADAGCGTGVLTTMLAEEAKFVTGIDLSSDMLAIASERARELGLKNTQFICQDIKDLSLPAAVDIVISTCDTLNYILTPDDFEQALRKIYNVLKPGGFLAFDLLGNGRGKALKQGEWYDIDDKRAIFYETDVSTDGRIEYDVVCFKEERDGLYRRFEEHHVQQLFQHSLVENLLFQCGFRSIEWNGDFGFSPVEEADRLIFLCKREGISSHV